MLPRAIGITGATGVLGQRLVAELHARGREPACFAGDIRDADAVARWMQGIEFVIHAAAMVPTVEVAGAPGTAIAVNVAGTANVAKAAAAAGARVACISTAHVYRSSDRSLDENAALAPVSLYGLSKLQGEQWAQALAKDALILRLFSYFDARQAPTYLVPALSTRIASAAPGEALPLRGADSVRDMADARWLAHGCVALIEAGATGIVNVSAGCATSVRELATVLAAQMGRDDVTWDGVSGDVPDRLVADRSKLSGMIDLPPFSLDAAMQRFLAEREAAA